MLVEITSLEIIRRLVLAIIISGIIGFDREYKSRPAGIRTHILVCVGACVVALIQEQLARDALETMINHPDVKSVIGTDQGRLTAQVISGIGFLGAGTIIVNKRSVIGLTTAASIWAVACLGIAAGEGFYEIAILGFIAVLIVLVALDKVISFPSIKKIQIKYIGSTDIKQTFTHALKEKNIPVRSVSYSVAYTNEQKIRTILYLVEMPKNIDEIHLIDEFADHKNVLEVDLLES